MHSGEPPLRTALRQRSIRLVTLGFFSLTVGEWVLGTAVAIALFGVHGALAVGLVGARFILASVSSVAFAELADQRSPRTVLAGSALLRAVLAAIVVAAVEGGAGIILVAGLVWLDAAVGAVYRPAQARLLPSVARSPSELAMAATLGSTAKSSGQIVGALLGSIAAALGGAEFGGAVAAVLFGLAAACAGLLSAGHRARSRTTARRDGLGIVLGARALRAAPGATRIAFWSCSRSLGRGAWTSLGVLAALALLHMEETGYGVLMTAAGVGTILGISLSSHLAARRHLAAPFVVALAAPGVAFLLIGLSATPLVAVGAMIGWGAGMAVSDLSAQALLTRVVPPSESGRVTGFMEGAKLLAEGVGALAAPIIAEVVGLQAAFVVSGALILLMLLADLHGFRAIDRVAVGRVELLDLARGVPWFSSLRVDGLEAIVAPLRERVVPAGTTVIVQDAMESEWFLVRRGSFAVFVDGFLVGQVDAGGSFGERGLMRGEPRSATVKATEDAVVLTLERDDFLRALTGTDAAPEEPSDVATDRSALVERQPLLHAADAGTIAALQRAAREEIVPAGVVLFAQGDPADDWIVIEDGTVEIRVDGDTRRVLGPGDSLGEIAVLHNVPRTASARALTEVRVLRIDGGLLRRALIRQPLGRSVAVSE